MRRFRLALLGMAALAAALSLAVKGAVGFHATSAAAASPLMVVKGEGGVFLTDLAGGTRRPLVVGLAKSASTLTWYSWSPDGKYLLLVNVETASGTWDLLLADREGRLVRTLGRHLPASASFYPSWAVDGDRVAYLAARLGGQRGVRELVYSVDVNGRRSLLLSYEDVAGGCGGGGGDPTQTLYWEQTGNGGMSWPLQWSMKQRLALGDGMLFDLRAGTARHLGRGPAQLSEPALSPSGALAATVRTCGHVECDSRVVLVNPRTGTAARTVAPGEMPAWSPDGRFLYFVQRVPGRVLKMTDPNGNSVSIATYTTILWQADARGTYLQRLAIENAYGTGFLQVTPDGRSLVYSRVDNAWSLWQHRLSGGRFTDAMLQRYGPKVRIERLDLGRQPVTILAGVGLPAVQR